MIESFYQIENYRRQSKFQSDILNAIFPLLLKINLDDLSSYSFIKKTNDYVSISLVHKDDTDTNITLNVFKDHVNLNYISFINGYDDDFDITEFSNIYESCLLGDYSIIEFYAGRKLILSRASSENPHLDGDILPNSIWHKLYFWLYKDKFVLETVKFKSFI